MKNQESFSGAKSDFVAYVRKMIPDLLSNRLTVEGKRVVIPDDLVLDYKIQVDEDEEGGKFTLKAGWDYATDEEDDGEQEEEDQNDF